MGLLGPSTSTSTARGQWLVAPGNGFGGPFGGFGPGFGYGYGYSYGFGPTYAGFGYGSSAFGFPGYANGFGIYPGAFSVLNQPDVQSGLAYNAMATGRVAPFSYQASPFGGVGVGPYGYAGAAYYNPNFASGLSPLAVQSAMDELALQRAGPPIRFRVVPAPPVD